MAANGVTGFIEQVAFFNGQRLFAQDLQELEDYNQQLRWLHNRSLHQWGVAMGYAVSGNKGDGQVSIQPGYAIDINGREVVLTAAQIQPVPPVAGDSSGNPVSYDLTVSYNQQQSETRAGVCNTAQGVVRVLDVPTFCWLPANSAASEDGVHIRLAQVEVYNCKLNKPVSIAQRQNAKPATQPYVAAASTQNANASWKPAVATDSGLTITQTVDTSSGNFRITPAYFVELRGDRSITITVSGSNVTLILDGFVRIANPAPASFDVDLLVPTVLLGNNKPNDLAPGLAAALSHWYIDWIGVEP